MSKVWEFFENMNEAVYASDVDTYELLYLNKAARDLFQFRWLFLWQPRQKHGTLKMAVM